MLPSTTVTSLCSSFRRNTDDQSAQSPTVWYRSNLLVFFASAYVMTTESTFIAGNGFTYDVRTLTTYARAAGDASTLSTRSVNQSVALGMTDSSSTKHTVCRL